eukprot:scaffold435849_cov41-Prasinocladus_malaysianus.AAC.1
MQGISFAAMAKLADSAPPNVDEKVPLAAPVAVGESPQDSAETESKTEEMDTDEEETGKSQNSGPAKAVQSMLQRKLGASGLHT